MKKLIITIIAVFIFGFSVFGQSAQTPSSNGWQNVTVTRNPDDVKGLKKVCDINTTAKMVFGSQTTLRKQAIEKAQKQAFDKGSQIVLIEEDHYDAMGIHNVNIIGEAYAKPSNTNSSQPVEEPNNAVQAMPVDTLKNSDIIEMARKKIPDEIIILKIKHSTCHFNTSADGLAELVKSGVHEKVIEAMIQ